MKPSVENPYGKARRLLRETGLAIENNQFVFTLAQWEAIDFEAAKLEAKNDALKADKRLLMHVVHGRAMASSLPKHLKEE